MLPRSNRETLMGYRGNEYVPYRSSEEYGRGQQNGNATLRMIIPNNDEFEQNQEERCAILLCLDRSGSMKGKSIEELAKAVDQFGNDLRENPAVAAKVDVGMVLFNEAVQWHDFANSSSFNLPEMKAEGGTKMSFAIDVSLDMCERRKDLYKENGITYHRPWIILITDGLPEHDLPEEIQKTHERLKDAEEKRRAAIFAIACGEDSEELAEWLSHNIAPPNRPAKRTSEANFRDLFKWLSNSQIALSKSSPGERVDLPSTDGWEIV